MRGRNAKPYAGLVLCLALCGCQEKSPGEPSPRSHADGKAPATASPGTAPASAGLPQTRSEALNAALKPFSLGTPACAGNLAVVPILTCALANTGGDYLTLAEALEKKLVTIKELERGGSVPTLVMTSNAAEPVLIPFGAIVTGGKQDRMIKDDVVLKPKESRKVAVYCIERGRWSAGDSGASFAGNAYYASNHIRCASNLKSSQVALWSSVASQNHAMSNLRQTANFQGNFETKAFKEAAAELEPVRKAVEAEANAAGAVAIVNGKVTGAEICASPEYFRKLWPQLFKGYVVDASAAKGKEKAHPAKAAETAGAYMAAIGEAKVETKQKEPQLRISIEAKDALGGATIEPGSGRLVYLRFFPRPAAVNSPGHDGAGQNVLYIGGHVQWQTPSTGKTDQTDQRAPTGEPGGEAKDDAPERDPRAPGR